MQMFHVYFMDKIYHTTLIITAPNTSLRTLFPGGGHFHYKADTMLVQKRTLKRGCFSQTMYAHTVKRVSKLTKSGKRVYFYNS